MQRGQTNRTTLADLPAGAYEAAFGHSGPKFKGREVLVFGVAPRTHNVQPPKLRSMSAGCPLKQAASFNRKYGHLGVEWRQSKVNPYIAEAVFGSRAAKVKTLRALNMHDNDEYAS